MMKIKVGLLVFAVALAWEGVSSSASSLTIVGKTEESIAQGVLMKNFLAYNENIKGQRPGVLVVPEWWGVNDYARKRARMLAELGYTALVVDMYGEGKQAMTPDEAGKLSSEVMKNLDVAKGRFMAAMELLKKQTPVDPNRIAAIGYCFGGGIVLNMARQNVDLKGVASFHGGLTPVEPAQPGGVKAKILALTGSDDGFVPTEQVEAFKREMKAAGADFQVISYPGAKHSFTNPEADSLGKKFNMPIAYNSKADKESWDEMKNFLETIFKK
jgi:dienelactone hydrolase